ncbi:MAG TPA: nickel-binding protein [Burkholderiales bacterium]|nr:nickel-binding protein [Burkholderiales bacterium]
MKVFVAERSLKGISMQDLAAAQKRAIETAGRLSREGRQVRYLRSTFVPDSGACSCLFEAQDAATVEALNMAAKIPYDRIAPALDLHP